MHVILAYKNFAANRNISHIGLGVAALNTCKVLHANHILCDVWPILNGADLFKRLTHHLSITHVVISAPWIPTLTLNELCIAYPRITFVMNCHSNVGFLQADPNGMKLLREALELESSLPNFHVSANSEKMHRWIEDAYGHPCLVLPNLYYLSHRAPGKHHRPLWHGGVLRIGSFGATRPQKNLVSAVGAAMEIGHQLKAETEIWISSGRSEGGGNTVLNTAREMIRGLPHVTLRESGWQSWPQFRHLVASMHLMLQPSYTESFNMVTADGIAEGVPSVVSEAIHWAPVHWRAECDDVFDIARVGRALLHDHHAAREGLYALEEYIRHGLREWKSFLT